MTTTNSANSTQPASSTRPTGAAAVDRISRFGLINCYLVSEDDGLTLIDTTIGGSAKKILAAVERTGQPLRRILLTHAHQDHVGSLDKLHELRPDVEVIISVRDARLLALDLTLDPDEPQSKLAGGYSGAKTKPDRTVVDGDRVGSLLVIATPGHTPGHIALLDARDDTLYCGDVFTTAGGVATSAKANRVFPLAQMGTWDKPTDLRSAQRLLDLRPARLAPGHGRVVAAPNAAMEAAITRGL